MSLRTSLSQEPTVFLSRKLWRFSRGRHGLIALYIGMFIMANLVMLTPPIIFGAFIREIQHHGLSAANLRHLLLLLLLLFSTEIAFWAFHGPARIIERTVAFWSELNYRRFLLEGVLDLGLTWHGEHDSGDTIDKVNKAGDGMMRFARNVFQVIQIIVRLMGTAIALLWFSPAIGAFVFVVVIASFVVIFQYDRFLIPQYRKLNEFSNKAMASVFDALSNITSVKILHIETPVVQGIMARLTAPHDTYQANSRLNEWKWFTGGVLFQVISIIPVAYYVYHAVAQGAQVDTGTVSTLYLYLTNLTFVYFGFTEFYQDLAVYKNQVMNAQPIEDSFIATRTHRLPVPRDWEQLEIQGLRFAYGAADLPHLDDVSLAIRRGERIAVIGESGSGKTTFLKVLHGLYPTAEGRAVFDGSKSFTTSFADLDLKTMLVPQEPELFSSTIRENITLGIAYPEEDILHAARIANFEKVVEQLPRGLDSVINEKGVNLSGGQKQRLALSRALLFAKDKDLILLDESTSSVDAENETEIYTNIWNDFADKTVIASIHKMNLLKLFDRIYVFEKGRIADTGSFDDLLARNASFKDAWEVFIATNVAASDIT